MEKNKTPNHHPKGKCFVHLPTLPPLICPRVCPPTHPSVLSSTLSHSGSPRRQGEGKQGSRRWEAGLTTGPAEKLDDTLGTQREEPPRRGCSGWGLTAWWGRTHWRIIHSLVSFENILKLLLDSGPMLVAGAVQVSKAVAIAAPRRCMVRGQGGNRCQPVWAWGGEGVQRREGLSWGGLCEGGCGVCSGRLHCQQVSCPVWVPGGGGGTVWRDHGHGH